VSELHAGMLIGAIAGAGLLLLLEAAVLWWITGAEPSHGPGDKP
jgi:hypothetical protein